MSDILERLADLPNQPNSVHYQSYVHCIAHDAAEEIKRLRFLVKAFEGIASDSIRQGWRRAPWRVPRGEV